MDKKSVSIIAVIGTIMLALVIYVICISGNTSSMTKNDLLKIEDSIYTVEDAKNYILMTKEADGDISKELSDEETESAITDFLTQKLYSVAAYKKGITVPSGEIEEFKKDYAEKTDLAAYGVSEEQYVEYASSEYMVSELTGNLGEYYTLPETYYDDVIEAIEDPLKSYAFRIMTFYYEEPTSGEEVSESGDVEGEEAEEVEDTSRDAIYMQANDVRNKLLSGEDFAELAKEYSSYRYTFNGASYTFLNGDVEYATSILLQDKLGSEELYNAVKDLNSGEYTEIIENEEQSVFNLVKVESVEDGFTGEADRELREILLYQYQENLVMEGIHYHVNQSALLRLY